MNKNIKWIIVLSYAAISCPLYAAIPNTNTHPTTFVGPAARGAFTGMVTDTSGYSFAAEVGPKNLRGGATVGLTFANIHHLKLTGEYLWQKIDYAFFAGLRHDTIDQGALGAEYLLDINPTSHWNPQFDLTAYYSDAGAAALTDVSGTYINAAGVPVAFTDSQSIADANAKGISPGMIIQPWRGAKTGLALNYDDVQYNTKFASVSSAKGFGATAHYDQRVTNNVGFGALAGVRKPFNTYQANVAFDNLPYANNWVFKVIGAYTVGKQSVPNTYNLMLSADYFLDRYCDDNCAQRNANEFMDWLAKPAVYMPQVLASSEDVVS